MTGSTSSWEGFLPPHAIVMARAKPRQVSDTVSPVVSATIPLLLLCAAPIEGQAALLLSKMIEAMGLKRDEAPLRQVTDAGLDEAFLSLRPRMILALGEQAARMLLVTEDALSSLRGKFRDRNGIPLLTTFDPNQLIQNPELKRDAWSDLQLAARELGLALPSGKTTSKKG